VHYHHVRVPAAYVVGEVDGGLRYVIDSWTQSASCSRPRPSATATGSSIAPSTTPPSGRSSARGLATHGGNGFVDKYDIERKLPTR